MDDLQALAAHAYAAALDPSMLAAWTEAARDWIGANTIALGVIDRIDAALAWQHIAHPDPSGLADYFRLDMHLLDPQLPLVLAVRRSAMYRTHDRIDLTAEKVRAYRDFMQTRGGIDHSATTATALSDDRHVVTLTAHNRVADGAIEETQWRRLAMLAPIVERSMALGILHARKLTASYWDANLAARTEPTALLDAQSRLLRMTPELAAILAQQDGLGVRDGRLTAVDPQADATLVAALGRMGQVVAKGHGVDNGEAAVRVPRRSGRPAYVVTLWPVMPVVRHLVPDRTALLVTVIDPAAIRQPRPRLWREAFGFTAREAEVAQLLVIGHSPESAAAALAMTLGTIRVHIRRLLSKTRTVRQADLLQLLMRIG